MLSSALLLAQKQVASETLHPSPAVQHVLNQLNDKYHQCLVSISFKRFFVWFFKDMEPVSDLNWNCKYWGCWYQIWNVYLHFSCIILFPKRIYHDKRGLFIKFFSTIFLKKNFFSISTETLESSDQVLGNNHFTCYEVSKLNFAGSIAMAFQIRSQELASLGLPGPDPAMAVISAERIMYKHAIQLCQSAALDELFGNPHLCSQRYLCNISLFCTLYY